MEIDMVLTGKFVKNGHSVGLHVPKALANQGILELGKIYTFKILKKGLWYNLAIKKLLILRFLAWT